MKENKSKAAITYEELMKKAEKMMLVYNQATGSAICIYDSVYKPHFPEIAGMGGADCCPEKAICPYCVKFRPGAACGAVGGTVGGTVGGALGAQEPFPCYRMHIDAIEEANKKGGSHIYQCSLGLLFWTSPVYTEGSFSGAIRGSGFLFENTKMSVDIFANAKDTHVMCNNDISSDEFKERIDSLARVDREKLQSLAEMLLFCAEALSSGNEDYHEILRRRTGQQEVIAEIIRDLRAKYPENGVKPGYPLEKERMLIAALHKGDSDEAKRLLNELLAMLIFSNPGHFKYVQLRVTELVVLLSRVEISPGNSGNIDMEANSRSLKQVQESKTIEELTDILHTIVDRVSGTISSFQGIPHAVALRKAEIFILENFTRKVSLKEIANVAGLSAPYFSTIFREEMGENLSKYLNRLRVEKASRLLLETDMSLNEIAGCCCFEDQSWFSKIFKAFTGISPGRYRNQGGGIVRNIGDNNLSAGFLKTLEEKSP